MAKCAKGIQNAHFCYRPKANALPCPRGKARGTGDTTTLHTLPTVAPSWWASTSATGSSPPLRTTTPTRTLYWVALMMDTRALAAHL